MRKPRKIICRGIEYGSIKAFARAFGMCERTVQTRLGSGMTPEEIVSKPIRQTKRKFVPCDPSIQNCLNCTKEDCNCDLPPRPGETNTGEKPEPPNFCHSCGADLRRTKVDGEKGQT